MATHIFGGDWTTDKLERVRKYLCAYTTIFTRNPRASYFTTIYVDAFAGTGERASATRPRRRALEMFDPDAESLQKGSARIALEVIPPFDQYLFIERRASRVRDLEALRETFPDRAPSIIIERADANDFLRHWCEQTDWKRHRAVVFLDPYGMQVDWTTLEKIAATKAIDLWLLFPLGVAVSRLLTTNKPPPRAWADALTRILGTTDWKQTFYPKTTELTLFGNEETQRRNATFEAIGTFFLARLETIFQEVAPNPLQLLNSRDIPIYLLCFAAGNPKGAKTAVKIAKDILA